MINERKVRLGDLKKGEKGSIVEVGNIYSSQELIKRLLQMGLLEGARVEVMHEAPFGGDPMAVKVRGSLIALRRSEADLIEVLVYE